MGLADDLKNMAYSAILDLGNAMEAVTFKSRNALSGQQPYNPRAAHGSNIDVDYTTKTGVLASFGDEIKTESDMGQEQGRVTMRKAFIPAHSLGTIVPKTDDVILRSDGSLWRIKECEFGPGQAGYYLEVRSR